LRQCPLHPARDYVLSPLRDRVFSARRGASHIFDGSKKVVLEAG
jgi:hypothetical protein